LFIAWEGDQELINLIDQNNLQSACGAGRMHCTITSTGKVKPCPSWSDDDPFSIAGDCTLDGISKIWKNAPDFRLLQSKDIPVCKDCKKHVCFGGCRLRAYRKYGELPGGPDPRCVKKQKTE
jgi:radical SAM protein with 4Fe4S-binding SPASM domain